MQKYFWICRGALLAVAAAMLSQSLSALAQKVTYKPYIESGDNGPFGSKDQMVVAWQTDEPTTNPSAYAVNYGRTTSYGHSLTPSGRGVDNYL